MSRCTLVWDGGCSLATKHKHLPAGSSELHVWPKTNVYALLSLLLFILMTKVGHTLEDDSQISVHYTISPRVADPHTDGGDEVLTARSRETRR